MIDTNVSLLNANKIELHYWFNDDSHTMDAIIQNKCETEFLAILKEISSKLKVDLILETEPLAEGGLRRYFKVLLKSENKNAIITTTLVTSILTAIIVTPISSSVSKAAEKIIEKIFEDNERKELEKEGLRLDNEKKRLNNEKLKIEIESLKQETQSNVQKLDSSNIIKKRRSNFYEALEGYSKIKKVTFSVNDKNNEPLLSENVSKNDFKKFILATDDLEPLEIDNAVIEIISPVLKKGNYKWIGIYNGELISFYMKSNEFKTRVQIGEIEFKNGSSINCELEIKRKMDGEGLVKNTQYNVLKVNDCFENKKPLELPDEKNKKIVKNNKKLV